MVARAFNPSTWKAEAVRSLSSRPASSTEEVPWQPGRERNLVLKNKNKTKSAYWDLNLDPHAWTGHVLFTHDSPLLPQDMVFSGIFCDRSLCTAPDHLTPQMLRIYASLDSATMFPLKDIFANNRDELWYQQAPSCLQLDRKPVSFDLPNLWCPVWFWSRLSTHADRKSDFRESTSFSLPANL